MTLNQYIQNKLDETNVDPNFLEDCRRICDVAKTMDIELSCTEANRIWLCYSSSRDAQWLSVNENADVISAIHEYVNQSLKRFRSHLMVGEFGTTYLG